MDNLTVSRLKPKLGNKSRCQSKKERMIKGRDFHLMVSSGLSQGSQTWTHTLREKSCGLNQQQPLYHRLSDFSHLWEAAAWELVWFMVLPSTKTVPLNPCRCYQWRFFHSEKAVELFQNQGGDIVLLLYLRIAWGWRGRGSQSWSCSCLGVVSYAVLQVRNLGAAHVGALPGAKQPGPPTEQQKMSVWDVL